MYATSALPPKFPSPKAYLTLPLPLRPVYLPFSPLGCSSPKYLVDLGSGLFTRFPSAESAGGPGSVRDIPEACPSPSPRPHSAASYSPSPPPSFFPSSLGRRQHFAPRGDADKEKRLPGELPTG